MDTSGRSPTTTGSSGNWWPIRCNSTRPQPDIVRAPQFAEHTDEILRELGFDDEELIELKIAGAVT